MVQPKEPNQNRIICEQDKTTHLCESTLNVYLKKSTESKVEQDKAEATKVSQISESTLNVHLKESTHRA